MKVLLPLIFGLFLLCSNVAVANQQALFITLDEYDHWENVLPKPNTSGLHQWLETKFGFTNMVLNNPNRKEVFNTLLKYQQQEYANEDQLLIYVLARGLYEASSSQWYLVPKDGAAHGDDPFQDTYISIDKVKGIVNNIPCKHILLIFDVISDENSFAQIPFKGKPEQQREDTTNPEIRKQFIAYTQQYHSRLYLAYSQQQTFGLYQNFEKILKKQDADGLLTFTDLRSRLEEKNIYAQVGTFGQHEAGGNFLFIRSDFAPPTKSTTKVTLEDDPAYQIILEGRKKHPEDTGLLFTEINFLLQKQAFDLAIVRLNEAIKKEPENISLYTTIGSVYENLYQQEAFTNKNFAKAEEYWNLALDYHKQALTMDANYYLASYSIGALFYNRAAELIHEMNEVTGFTKAELKKYEDLKAQIFKYFDQALPYFQKSEKLNPNDQNTLVALKEIYGRMDNAQLSTEFKNRLENVLNGKTNVQSYFK